MHDAKSSGRDLSLETYIEGDGFDTPRICEEHFSLRTQEQAAEIARVLKGARTDSVRKATEFVGAYESDGESEGFDAVNRAIYLNELLPDEAIDLGGVQVKGAYRITVEFWPAATEVPK